MKNLLKVHQAKKALERMKNDLAEAGIDVSDVKTIPQLSNVLCSILPEGMAAEAAGILEDPERVKTLLGAFGILADAGVLIDALYRPGDTVKTEDLYG